MPLEAVLIWLLVGAFCGWLAGAIAVGAGLGLIGDMVVGILGSMVGGYVLPRLGVHIGAGLLGYVINAVIGGVIILFIASLIRGRR